MKKVILAVFAAFGLTVARAASVPLVPEGATALHSISSKAADTGSDVWASNQVGPYLQINNADKSAFVLQADDTVEVKFKFNEVGRGACIFCDRKSGSAGKFNFMRTGDAKGRFDYGTENNTFTSPSINDTSKHVIVANGTSLKVDETSVTVASSTYAPSSNALLIFCCDNSGNGIANSGNTGSITMYYFRVKDGSGNIRLNLVPMKDANGVVGMYDQVNGLFFKSGNSHTFTAGSTATEADMSEYFLSQSEDPVDPSHTHDWSEWVTTVEPQVGVPGEKQRTCPCGEVETEVIPALPEPVADAALNFAGTAKTIRPKLHGAAFAPRLRLRGVMPDYMDELKALNLTLCRTHDLTLHDGSERIFDTHFLFPIFSCDEMVDANYYFKATDAAVKDIQSCGMNLVFRLGSSIDNRGSGYSTSLRYNTVDPGTDNYAKYARVLSHIVLHYAAAPYNVKYFEIWNEASNANGNDRYATWQKPGGGVGDLSNFNAFFATCLAQIKGDLATAGYTDVKVGGPAYCSWQQGNMENLMNKCREKGYYPDFISWHNYPNNTANVTALKADAATADSWLNSYCSGNGIDRSKIELSINEWHVYANGSAWELGEDAYKLGVFTIGTLIALQDSKLDQAQFYGSGYETSFAYLDPTSGQTGYQYAALKMFGEVVKNYTKRYPGIDNGAVSDSYFAATNEDGTKGCVVVADMSNNASVNLSMAGLSAVSNVKAYALDKGRKMTELSSGFSVTVTGVSVTKAQSAPGAYLFTFDMVKAN